MTPLIHKLYRFNHGAKSENKEVIEVIEEVNPIIDKNVTHIFDKGMNRPICRDFIIELDNNFIFIYYKISTININGIKSAQ